MANFAVDPRPHVLPGFTLEERPAWPMVRHEVYAIGCYMLLNEDLAIARLTLPLHKDDFKLLDKELKNFFMDVHQVCIADIQPCPIGDAYVRFGSALEWERFLGLNFAFGQYTLHL